MQSRFLSSAAKGSAAQAETTRAEKETEAETHFGFTSVPEGSKKPKVAEVFHRVANNYDLMNDVMSAGTHRLWKSQFISMLKPQPGLKLLDMAGGTGDISFGVIDAIRAHSGSTEQSSVTVSDINPSMLRVGEERAKDRGYFAVPNVDVEFVVADAEQLPFEDQSFDAYTIAFGLRNVTNIDLALREAHRVLKPGGRFMCLEFSKVENPLLATVYDAYSFNIIPTMGELVSSDRASYQYLVESIRRFPSQSDLVDKMKDAGFRCASYTNMTGGVVAVHSGFKI